MEFAVNMENEDIAFRWQHDFEYRCKIYESALNQLPIAVTIRTTLDKTALYRNSSANLVVEQGETTEYITTARQRVDADNRLEVWIQQSMSPVRNPLLQRLVHSSHIQFSICFPDGQVEFLSKALCERVGKKQDEMTGWQYEAVLHPEDAHTVTTDWRVAAALNGPYVSKEFRLYDAQGGIFWLVYSTSPVFNDFGRIARYVGVNNDVTDLVRLRKSAESERAIIQTAMDQLPVGLIVADAPSGDLRLVNRKAQEVCEHLLEKCSSPHGKSQMRWAPYHEEGRLDLPLTRCLKTGTPIAPEHLQYLRMDQTVGTLSSTATPVYSPGVDRMIAAVACIEDITDKLKAEEQKAQLMAAEHAAKATTELLANVSHELRTPLNAVIGMTELLFATGTLNTEQREYVQVIREAGALLLTVIGEVLDHEKLRAHKLELDVTEVNLESIIESVCTLMHELAIKANVTLECSVDDILHKRLLYGDEQRLKQIVMNLLSNAIRFTPEGGQVSVRAVALSEDDTTVVVRVEVSDSGIGIDEATQARLFKPFMQADSSTTRKFGGTGLGLAICKHLLDLMHGRIGVTSTMHIGSCFWFELPMKRCEHDVDAALFSHSAACLAIPPCGDVVCPTIPDASKTCSNINPQDVRILVAEDNRVNRLLIQRILRNTGFVHVTLVSDGKQAYEGVAANDFDIVLMDCQMPEMDGYEATRLIRALPNPVKSSIPIIALTASALPADIQRSIQAGMDGHVSKPYSSETLVNAMANLLVSKKC